MIGGDGINDESNKTAPAPGKVVYDPGDKATLNEGGWTPHSRSQFRINLNDLRSIYQEVREINVLEDI